MREPDDTTEQDKIQEGLIQEHIQSLVVQLTCGNVPACQRARRDLVALGRPAVPHLIGALTHPDSRVRWESAKALGAIGEPSAGQALVQALEDKQSDVRWVAAEALIQMGEDALKPVLEALESHAESVWLREGAVRVLDSLRGKGRGEYVVPVIEALKGTHPSMEVPHIAHAALEDLGIH